MKKKLILSSLMIAGVLAVFTGCVPGDGANDIFNPAGFFYGIWHGWIAPVSLIMSIFNNQYSIYEINNTGLLYDLGYYIAIISGFGGISLARTKSRRK